MIRRLFWFLRGTVPALPQADKPLADGALMVRLSDTFDASGENVPVRMRMQLALIEPGEGIRAAGKIAIA